MELSEYAEQILFGRTLADKLVDPGTLTDDGPKRSFEIPSAPGRPKELRFEGKDRTPFPSVEQLKVESDRGRALHYFANHELLAAELMALVLLRFVDAPKKFRLGLAKTISDEQRHLRQYLGRMATLGVGFGEVAMNDYFWRATANVATPLDFVARMSLGFEQANLDFSRFYETKLRALGDEVTADLMHEVYEDEIRHVRHGVVWFDTWRDTDRTAWDAHVALLGDTNPMRLKGPVLDREGRRRAGLPDDYVESLRLFRRTKGRRERVFVFNATAEEETQHGRRYSLPAGAAALERDLAFTMAFLAKPEDVVVARVPSRDFLGSLLDVGFDIPEIVGRPEDLRGRTLAGIVPWGASPRIDGLRRSLGLDEVPALDLYSKALTVELAAPFSPEAKIVRDPSDLEPGVIVKAPYAASGRHRKRIRTVEDLEDPSIAGWVKNVLARDGFVVVEPWRRRVRDFGVVLEVGRKDPLLSVLELYVDDDGRYRGHRLGRAHARLGVAIEADFSRRVREVADHIAKSLLARGYRGPAGFDMFVYEDDEGRRILRPVVDVNVRYTMGHVARAIGERVAPRTEAEWHHLPLREVQAAGFADFVAWSDAARERFAVVVEGGRIQSGALCTTDPSQAEQVLTVLLVGDARALAPPRSGSGAR